MKRTFGPYLVELIERGDGQLIAWGDAADWPPRKAAELYDERALRAGLAAGVRVAVIDFSRRAYVNSGTLAALLKIDAFFRAHGGSVELVGLDEAGRYVLEMIGVVDRFRCHPDRSTALAVLKLS